MLFFSQCLVQFLGHCFLNFLIEIRVVKQFRKGVVVIKETLGHNIAELIREQRPHEHFGTVVLGIFSELLNLRVPHEHLIDPLDDEAVGIGEVTAEAVVTKNGFNTLASLQMALQFGDKAVKCGDQSNRDLYGKSLLGKALCLPQTIGSTTGGLVLYCACSMRKNPACLLFANHIDSLAAAGAVLADVWVDGVSMPVIDMLGDEFLNYVQDGMKITIMPDGIVHVE